MNSSRIVIPVLSMSVQNYINALNRAGAEPIVIHNISDLNMNEADGLLVPGGGDIDPKRYHAENEGSEGIEDDLDTFQFAVMDKFVSAKKPILGICRGHQLINVYFGGDMIQNLSNAFKHARDAGADIDKYHEAESRKGSWIESIYGSKFLINSSHHQAVKTPGKNMVVDLFSTEDHIVEACHHTSLPIWTVQWHPERCLPSYNVENLVDGGGVFSFFLQKVKENQA